VQYIYVTGYISCNNYVSMCFSLKVTYCESARCVTFGTPGMCCGSNITKWFQGGSPNRVTNWKLSNAGQNSSKRRTFLKKCPTY